MKYRNLLFAMIMLLMSAVGVDAQIKPFKQTLTLQGVTFNISCPNSGSINKVTITTRGLARNVVTVREFEGTVTGAEIGDLNIDGSPEIYIFGSSAGSGSYGKFLGFAALRKRSLGEIYLPELAEGSKEIQGYMGHDEFAVVESTFVRRFPIYKPGDSNAQATGGTRQIQYKLKAGENGYILAIDKVVEY